jgi:hypothetical protein
MIDTTSPSRPGRSSGSSSPARILRRAQGTAMVNEPRLQLAFDGSTGAYRLAML